MLKETNMNIARLHRLLAMIVKVSLLLHLKHILKSYLRYEVTFVKR